MPIAICYVHDQQIKSTDIRQMVTEWAASLEMDEKDIHLSVVYSFVQAGYAYRMLVHLFLPSLHTRERVEHIQITLHRLLTKLLKADPSEIFIITTIVPSGQVLNNGHVQTWSDRMDGSVL